MTNTNDRKFKTRDGRLVARIHFRFKLGDLRPMRFRLHGKNDWHRCYNSGRVLMAGEDPLDVMGLENFDMEADQLERESLKELP